MNGSGTDLSTARIYIRTGWIAKIKTLCAVTVKAQPTRFIPVKKWMSNLNELLSLFLFPNYPTFSFNFARYCPTKLRSYRLVCNSSVSISIHFLRKPVGKNAKHVSQSSSISRNTHKKKESEEPTVKLMNGKQETGDIKVIGYQVYKGQPPAHSCIACCIVNTTRKLALATR